MRTPIRLPGRTRFLSPLTAAAIAVSLLSPLGAAAPVAASPARPAATHSAAWSAPQGPVTGTACSPSCDLYAVTGTMPAASLPGAPAAGIAVWGYNTSGAAATAPGGPTLVVNQGDAVAITLHNVDVPSATSLMIAGQPIIPDTTGVTQTNATTYSIPAGVLNAGTYLYEAGLTADGPRQVAMGLYGALIVRPTGAPGQAYAATSTAFDDEAVLVLSEIDPALNASPASFEMSGFAPKYWLIDGKAYPNTDPIATDVGRRVLLRYVNAGLQHHSMGLLGTHQAIIATGAQPAANASTVVAETVPAGGTLDAIVSVPAGAPAGTKYALFDAAMHTDNMGVSTGGVIDFGGMLAFMTVGGTATSGGGGPVTSGVSLSPNPSNGSASVTLSATVTASAGANLTGAEYFVDSFGANGTGTAFTPAPGGPSAAINATITVAQLAALSPGNHTFYVHGQDSSGTPGPTWGAFASAVLNLDKAGPAISGMSLTPSVDNGTANVQLQATASDVATGNQNVTAAEYSIDGGSATPISISTPATVVSLSATIPAATVLALPDGNHTVAVRAQDALGNFGAPGSISLRVDKSAPGTSAVSAQPNPNNGTLGVQITSGGAFYVRIDATVADPSSGGVSSNVTAAEYFFDTVGANGSGGAMIPADGSFNSPSELVYGAVDLIHINALSTGTHTIYVHGRDAAGNWGATTSTSFLIDRTSPTFTGISLAPNPTNGAPVVTLTPLGAADAGGAGVGGGEYWINPPTNTTPAPGSGTQFSGATASIPVAALATGTYTVSARIRDAAGNWSTGAGGIRSATLTVWADPIFSNGFDTGTRPWGWSSASTNNATRLNVGTPALVGTRSLRAQGNNTNYVQFNFGTAAIPAAPTFDARFYFNPNNNASTGQDIFAAATSTGFGTQLFHVRYRRNGAQPQVQIQVGATANPAWVSITNATHRIEVVWQAVGSGGPNPGTLVLYVDGASSQTLTTASIGSVAAVRLGSVTSGGSATIESFDAFVSKRTVSPLVGP